VSTVTQTIRQAIIDAVLQIAPEADFARVDAKRSLRQQLDIDSFDFLNLLIDLHARLGVEIPEADYAKVDTLEAMEGYLAARGAPKASAGSP
jgi:acyl carrier protein